jgi:branched-chain amino acid transport system permease protein
MGLVLEGTLLGLMTGGVYALMASGLTLIFGVMRIVNVAQGALVILGAYLSFALQQRWHVDPFLSVVLTAPALFLLGVALERAFLRPLKTDREPLSILVTFAIALGVEGVLGYVFSANYRQIQAWYVTASWDVGGFHFPLVYVYGFALSVAVLGLLYLLLYRTSFGRALRATVQSPVGARLVGVDVDRVTAITFGIGVSTAAVGGMIFGATNAFDPGSHYDLISRLLTIIVLGGMGSLGGALLASAVMLVVEDVTSLVASPVWSSVAFFVLLVLVLVLRPQGLFGQAERGRL